MCFIEVLVQILICWIILDAVMPDVVSSRKQEGGGKPLVKTEGEVRTVLKF